MTAECKESEQHGWDTMTDVSALCHDIVKRISLSLFGRCRRAIFTVGDECELASIFGLEGTVAPENCRADRILV